MDITEEVKESIDTFRVIPEGKKAGICVASWWWILRWLLH